MTDADITEAGADVDAGVAEVGGMVGRVVENVERVIVGHHDVVEHLMTGVLGRGHVLVEDVPGVGKTMLARAVAQSFDCSFKRIQFTPDLLPSDVTGVNVYNQATGEFEFRPGPVFANVVLGDEINRAPPKTQSALLEAMEESQVTVDGETHPIEEPYVVIATQNSVEHDRTYDLPTAELDRFVKKLDLGYPEEAEEVEVLGRVVGGHPIESLDPVASVEDLVTARQVAASVAVETPVREYATRLATYTREHAELGVSPRGSIALLRAAQGRALLDERDYVVPDDVQTEAIPTLAHRIQSGGDRTGTEIVAAALETVEI
ncbi:MAG: AAA family ATPase [Haloarculaceae archaeon]